MPTFNVFVRLPNQFTIIQLFTSTLLGGYRVTLWHCESTPWSGIDWASLYAGSSLDVRWSLFSIFLRPWRRSEPTTSKSQTLSLKKQSWDEDWTSSKSSSPLQRICRGWRKTWNIWNKFGPSPRNGKSFGMPGKSASSKNWSPLTWRLRHNYCSRGWTSWSEKWRYSAVRTFWHKFRRVLVDPVVLTNWSCLGELMSCTCINSVPVEWTIIKTPTRVKEWEKGERRDR